MPTRHATPPPAHHGARSAPASPAALDQPQIEQLFHAVAAGGPSVQFEDFIEAHSTKYYLRQLAGVQPKHTLEA